MFKFLLYISICMAVRTYFRFSSWQEINFPIITSISRKLPVFSAIPPPSPKEPVTMENHGIKGWNTEAYVPNMKVFWLTVVEIEASEIYACKSFINDHSTYHSMYSRIYSLYNHSMYSGIYSLYNHSMISGTSIAWTPLGPWNMFEGGVVQANEC